MFLQLTGLTGGPACASCCILPFTCTSLIAKIDREAAHTRSGRPARIIAKLNSLPSRR